MQTAPVTRDSPGRDDTEPDELVTLQWQFHTFGAQFEVEGVAKTGDGLHDGGVVGSVPSPSTKVRSILSVATGSSFSLLSDEKPVPKSSRAITIPASARPLRIRAGQLGVVHQRALGYLEMKAVGRKLVPCKGGETAFEEVLRHELLG